MFCGGIGSGKTSTGSHFALFQIQNNPLATGFIGANSYKQLNQSTFKNFFGYLDQYKIDYVFNVKPPWKYRSKFKNHDGIISFPNKCQIITRSLENYDDIRGVEIGWFWNDETRDTKKEAWDMLKGRLRDKDSNNLCGLNTTTPNGYDWQHEEFVIKPSRNDEGKKFNQDHGFVISSTRENEKNLPEGYIQSLEDSYDEFLAKQELGGEFINSCSGRAYYGYSELNNDMTITYNNNLALYIGMDFNVDPMTAVLYQNYPERKGERTYIHSKIFHVYYLRGSNTELTAKKIISDYPDAPSYMYTPCQSSTARQTVAPIGLNDLRIVENVFRGKTFHTLKRSKNPLIRDRLAVVNNRLSKGLVSINPSGKGCKELISDWQTAYWVEGKDEIDWGGALRGHACAGFDYSQECQFRIERPNNGNITAEDI